MPAERVEAADIEKLAWRAVGLGGIELELAGIADDGRD